MSSPHAERQSTSSTHRQRQEDDLDETRSLLPSPTRSQDPSAVESIAVQEVPSEPSKPAIVDDGIDPTVSAWPRSTRYLLFLCGFLTSLSFGVTQVPMLYVFRLMTCDAYYDHHPLPIPNPDPQTLVAARRSILSYALPPAAYGTGATVASDFDRCSIHAIESSTALSVSLLGASTTLFGVANLFLTGSLIKRIGLKRTLLIQGFFPAVRLLVQNVGVEVWGNTGIIIVQCSQIVSIIGGPSGYILVLNSFVTEVVEYEERTASLGRLAGSMTFGAAIGFLLGGVVAEEFGIKAPFRLTCILFLTACLYVLIFLPHIPPPESGDAEQAASNDKKAKKSALGKFVGPMAVFAPRNFITRDGILQKEYGAFLLACGVFLAILATGRYCLSSVERVLSQATGYQPTLLQLYATGLFGFGTKQNGWLIFMYSSLRGAFLTFAFPRIIAAGRHFFAKEERNAEGTDSSERTPLLSSQIRSAAATESDDRDDKIQKKDQTFKFDLIYTRFSLLADGLLTMLCSFVREGWQMYLVAAVLPFAAGTGSASKGTILHMVGSSAGSSERTDALAGISLVENMARLSTSKSAKRFQVYSEKPVASQPSPSPSSLSYADIVALQPSYLV
ncbi:MAG: hypothetical protein MMC23_004128 [Stictis urceolatum]|nr:hypothetical protein [Stictis urceolata]